MVWILSVLLFQRLGQRVFGCQVSVDLLAIRVVVREGGIDLREGEEIDEQALQALVRAAAAYNDKK